MTVTIPDPGKSSGDTPAYPPPAYSSTSAGPSGQAAYTTNTGMNYQPQAQGPSTQAQVYPQVPAQPHYTPQQQQQPYGQSYYVPSQQQPKYPQATPSPGPYYQQPQHQQQQYPYQQGQQRQQYPSYQSQPMPAQQYAHPQTQQYPYPNQQPTGYFSDGRNGTAGRSTVPFIATAVAACCCLEMCCLF